LKRLTGFNQAKSLLTRRVPFGSVTLPPEWKARIKDVFGEELSAESAVKRILDDVRDRGDEALLHYTKKLDGVELGKLEVSREETSIAYNETSKELISALKLAAERIRDFHLQCQRKGVVSFRAGGLGQQVRPLNRVGIYVPGGAASYPSTVLMAAIPARVAGVKEIIMATPPKKEGSIPAATLVAADIAKVDRIFKIGGAQAIGALAFGTKSVPQVDKICGPGNIFVVLAKKMVYGVVDIDGLQGPSEIMIIADETANPDLCAVDLVAQAEHDPLALAVLITTSADLADKVDAELAKELIPTGLTPKTVPSRALENGVIAVVDTLDETIELANLFAPEHLSLMVKNADAYLGKIANAGCVFVGDNSPVALGDYIAGPSHVLPTGGSARFGSPLGINDFVKITNVIALDKATLMKLGPAAVIMAKAEGLLNHARAIEKRMTGKKR